MSQLNDIAILLPGAHLKARSSSKSQHSSDHCLEVASHTPTYFFLKDRSFQLFCLLPRNGLAQLFPRVQFVSDCKDCVSLLDIRIRKIKSDVRGKSSKVQVTTWGVFSVYYLININSNSQV